MTPSDHMSEKYIILTEKYQQQLTLWSLCPAGCVSLSLTCPRADEVIIDHLGSHKLRGPDQALDLQ